MKKNTLWTYCNINVDNVAILEAPAFFFEKGQET